MLPSKTSLDLLLVLLIKMPESNNAAASDSAPTLEEGWVRPSEPLHAHFDCFSGAAGDMILASCVDAARDDGGKLLRHVEECLRRGLPELDGEFSITRQRVWRGSGQIAATHIQVHSRYNHAPAPVPQKAETSIKDKRNPELDNAQHHNNAGGTMSSKNIKHRKSLNKDGSKSRLDRHDDSKSNIRQFLEAQDGEYNDDEEISRSTPKKATSSDSSLLMEILTESVRLSERSIPLSPSSSSSSNVKAKVKPQRTNSQSGSSHSHEHSHGHPSSPGRSHSSNTSSKNLLVAQQSPPRPPSRSDSHDHKHSHAHSSTAPPLTSHDHSHAHAHNHSNNHDHSHSHGHSHGHTHDGHQASPSSNKNTEHHHDHSHSHGHSHGHNHQENSNGPLRNLPEIRGMLEQAPAQYIPSWVRDKAILAFTELAKAEAAVHGAEGIDHVHFHEVGAVDSIVDTVGSLLALHALGAETFSCSRLPLGEGTVRTDHGLLPVPAPATLRLMIGMPTTGGPPGIVGELVTPTGAALLRALVPPIRGAAKSKRSTTRPPQFTLLEVGLGAGTKEFGTHPNVLRLMLGEGVVSV